MAECEEVGAEVQGAGRGWYCERVERESVVRGGYGVRQGGCGEGRRMEGQAKTSKAVIN